MERQKAHTRHADNLYRLLAFRGPAVCQDRLFNLRTEEIILYRIRDISLRRSLGQRIFGVGTVHICSSDHTCPELDVKNVRHSEKVKEMIHEQVEQMKLERRVRVNELIDGSDLNDPDNNFDEDLDPAADEGMDDGHGE